MTEHITERMVRKWAGKFFNKNEFLPSAKLCADHFEITKEEAEELLRRVYRGSRGEQSARK